MPTMSSKERKATLREFYGLFFFLWLLDDKRSVCWFFNFFVLVNIFCFHLLDVCNLLFLAAVIYPSLRQLEGEFIELEDNALRSQSMEVLTRKRGDGRMKLSDNDLEKEEECGICMENCTRMLLPSCGHTMCNSCFHDW